MTSAPRALRNAAALAAGVALLSSCRERGRPDPTIRMAVSHEPEETSPSDGAPSGSRPGEAPPRVPNRLEVPAAVTQAYSGIVLRWRDSASGKEGRLDVPLGGSAPLPGSPLTIAADVFLPAFTMTADAITSGGIEPENPAARIRVAENGKEIFGGWIFQRFPDVHPFSHPRFSLRLDGGVRKSGK